MKVNELTSKMDLINLNTPSPVEISGVVVTDIVSDVVTHAKQGTVVVTAQAHSTIVSAAKLVDAAAIIFTLGREPAPEVVKLADKAGISLFTTDNGAYQIAIKLHDLGL